VELNYHIANINLLKMDGIMILDYQNMVKASKLKKINARLHNIFLRSMEDKTDYLDFETLDKYEIKENNVYIKGGFLNTLTFVGYTS